MNKVLVKIYVPMLEYQFDVKLPLNKELYKVIYLLIQAIYDISDNYYTPSELPQLYEKWSAYKYNMNLTVKENRIKNGAELILI